MTLLEVIVSLVIISTATIGLNSIADRFSDDTKNTVAASQVRTFGEAAKAYIKTNYSAVQLVATPTTAAMIDVPTLIATGNLPAGYLSTNAYDQSLCALMLEPVANKLQVIVVTEGGTAIDDISLGNIAAVIGGSGGGIYTADTANIKGAIGGWTIASSTFHNLANNQNKKCDGTAGRVQLAGGHSAMALWFENGDTTSAYLSRDAVPGRPELNQMNTPLIMGAGTQQTAESTCTASELGKLGRDATGKLLTCNGANWKLQGSAYWQDAVATYAALPACDAASINQTRTVQTPTIGTGPRAYTCDGTTWQALSVDDNGNSVQAGKVTAGTLQVNTSKVENDPCTTDGEIAKSSTTSGVILSCQGGTWKSSGGKTPIATLNFDGTTCNAYAYHPCAIRSSTGVNAVYQVTPNTGHYYVEFSSIQQNANYVVVASCQYDAATPCTMVIINSNSDGTNTNPTTSGFHIAGGNYNSKQWSKAFTLVVY